MSLHISRSRLSTIGLRRLFIAAANHGEIGKGESLEVLQGFGRQRLRVGTPAVL
jgi:hypothetical protein